MNELKSIIEDTIKTSLSERDCNNTSKPQLEILTRKQVADKLQVSYMTLHNWNKTGVLKAYGMGNRVYYKLDGIELAMNMIG